MMAEETPRRTPLYQAHMQLIARMVPFAGWEMPVQYTGILEEARTVRSVAGLFDISHMGRLLFSGPGALALIQQLTSNDVSSLAPGEGQYSLLTNPQGGIIDDIIVYRLGEDRFRIVVNASNTAKDLGWFRQHASADVDIDDETERTAMIAAQGPHAPRLVARVAGAAVLDTPRFAFTQATIAGASVTLCRTGYTGEDGFELILPADKGPTVWNDLLAAGAAPCGLGARDVLRIEAGYPLYGHEIDDTTTPVAAGLMWVVKPEKGDFIGREPILADKRRGTARRLVGITLAGRIVPRQGYTLLQSSRPVGTVTSGVFSPTVGHGLGMAYVDASLHREGTALELEVRGNLYPTTVASKKNLLER